MTLAVSRDIKLTRIDPHGKRRPPTPTSSLLILHACQDISTNKQSINRKRQQEISFSSHVSEITLVATNDGDIPTLLLPVYSPGMTPGSIWGGMGCTWDHSEVIDNERDLGALHKQ